MEISHEERIAVLRRVSRYRESEEVMAERSGRRREIRELTVGILMLLGPFWLLLDECLCWLTVGCRLLDPLEAYKKGAQCAHDGKEYLNGLREFLTDHAALSMCQETAASPCLKIIYGILRRAHASALYEELTTAYHMAYDTINRNAESFFRAGYYR